MSKVVYLDHHATTPLDRRVLEAMMPYLTAEFGNPASRTHEYGRRAEAAVEAARSRLAAFLGAHPDEIIFTAGATEANNLAIKGGARRARKRGGGTHLITTALEHKSVLASVLALEDEGFTSQVLVPERDGRLDPASVDRALTPETVLVSVVSANSEIGSLQPVEALAERCRERGVLFHTDATQSVGKVPVDVHAWGCDLLSLSAHKFYGPKGVGALFIRRGVQVEPLLSGGGQERGLRSGTLNVPGIVGLGAAAELCRVEMAAETAHVTRLRNRLWDALRTRVPECCLNGHSTERLPGNLNIRVPGVDGGALLIALKDFACSAGSACSSGKSTPSELLLALGLSKRDAWSSLRIGLGKSTTEADVDRFAEAFECAVQALRPGSRTGQPAS